MSVGAWIWSSTAAKRTSASAEFVSWRPEGRLLCRLARRLSGSAAVVATAIFATAATALAQSPEGGEANLKLPDLSQVDFLGINGHTLLTFGLLFCVFRGNRQS